MQRSALKIAGLGETKMEFNDFETCSSSAFSEKLFVQYPK